MHKEILRLAVPNIITMISIPLLSMADMALMGRMDSENYISALGISTQIFASIYWSLGFLRMGTTGIVAQAFGEQNNKLLSHTFYRAIILALGLAGILLLLQKPILTFGLPLFEATPEVNELAAGYYNIRIWAAPAQLMMFVLFGWILGMQNAVLVTVGVVMINVINIVLNLVFVLVLDMEIEGIALATVIAQYTGVAFAITAVIIKYSKRLQGWSSEVLGNVRAILRFFMVNVDLFIRTVCLVFAFTFFTIKAGTWGEDIRAVNMLLLQFMHLLSFGVDGFAMAAESLVGKYYGARDGVNYRLAIRNSFMWGLGIGLVFLFIFFTFGENILRLLTNMEHVIAGAEPYMWWLIIMPLINGVAFMWDGIYTGRTATASLRNTQIIATFLVFTPAYYFTYEHIGNHSLWLAMTLFMVARGVGLTVLAPRVVYKGI